eukprot:TRINITY_DN8015_c0_g1_i1.p3 TRINITY_DN8015_c0_g1~~TRINITY_DN8015_c0_g1_i1.p3  ORF type:complete len:155 (+),score=58.80 TRINITY_DN8015_c0_g1_i1:51-515(+)
MEDAMDELQIAEFREAFSLYDQNGEGTITTRELPFVMRSVGQYPSDPEMQDIVREVDGNGGSLDFPEFLDLMSRRTLGTGSADKAREANMRAAFAVFDESGNGTVRACDLHHVMTSLGEKLSDAEADAMIKEADVDGDGMIDYRRFAEVMTVRR